MKLVNVPHAPIYPIELLLEFSWLVLSHIGGNCHVLSLCRTKIFTSWVYSFKATRILPLRKSNVAIEMTNDVDSTIKIVGKHWDQKSVFCLCCFLLNERRNPCLELSGLVWHLDTPKGIIKLNINLNRKLSMNWKQAFLLKF